MVKPALNENISLIPDGPLQFVDIHFKLNEDDDEGGAAIRRGFYEYPDPDTGKPRLMCLEMSREAGGFIDRQTGQPAIDPGTGRRAEVRFTVEGKEALEVFEGKWVPIPIFRADDKGIDGVGGLATGPSDWARIFYAGRLEEPDEDENTHALVLAFDTVFGPERGEDDYHALIHKDEARGADFRFAYHVSDNAWFLNEEFVRDWTRELFREHVAKRIWEEDQRDLKDSDIRNATEHWARYLTFLEVLKERDLIPSVRVVNTYRNEPIDVDLILDVGNSRTCGMLVETRPGETTQLNDSYGLELRNLTNPVHRYREAFESRVEFAPANFGHSQPFAKASGRTGDNQWLWPSAVRIGPEAAALSVFSKGAKGRTGMSSPKRYLWDEYRRPEMWRFNSGSPDHDAEEPPVRGHFVNKVTNQGTPLEKLAERDLELVGRSAYKEELESELPPMALMATQPAFSRSSLMMFMLSEILMHALATINSPERRANMARSDVPRRLKRVLLTMPPAMPIAERKIFVRWARWAVDTLWSSLGWDKLEPNPDKKVADFRSKPEVAYQVDEASASQLVYLYNEISDRFKGDQLAFFDLLGRPRTVTDNAGDTEEKQTLRIASIDIGGGTTDLIITTYHDDSTGSTTVIRPRQDFREGFNLAGDDILKAVIEEHFLAPLEARIAGEGVVDAKGLMSLLLGGDRLQQSEQSRKLRGQFANQVAVPFGLRILNEYEGYDPIRSTPALSLQFGEVFTPETHPRNDVIDYFNGEVNKALPRSTVEEIGGFRLRQFELSVNLADVHETVKRTVRGALQNLGELVNLYQCDLVLLSGRPTRQPGPREVLLEKLPIPPSRIISMHQYRVGSWYPYRNQHSEVSDPKTTVAIGALLSTLSQGQLRQFSFRIEELKPRSTARYIGEMQDGKVLNNSMLFSEIDLDGSSDVNLKAEFAFEAPFPIGFRQLAAERWTATPFYWVDWSSESARRESEGKRPYQIKMRFRREADPKPGEELGPIGGIGSLNDEGVFEIDRVVDGSRDKQEQYGAVELRLQTLKDSGNYWLDTGSFNEG